MKGPCQPGVVTLSPAPGRVLRPGVQLQGPGRARRDRHAAEPAGPERSAVPLRVGAGQQVVQLAEQPGGGRDRHRRAGRAGRAAR